MKKFRKDKLPSPMLKTQKIVEQYDSDDEFVKVDKNKKSERNKELEQKLKSGKIKIKFV